jgi:hypothetical protein
MAASPVFNPDLDTIKARLRLSAVDTGDAAAVVDAAMEEVRLGLFAELGSLRVEEIQALSRETPAITDDGLTRLRADNIEQLWMRMILLQRLPSLFMQSAGVSRHAWNEEGITREASGKDIRDEVRGLRGLIRNGLAALLGQDTGDLVAYVPVPDETPPRPGDSILPPSVRESTL